MPAAETQTEKTARIIQHTAEVTATRVAQAVLDSAAARAEVLSKEGGGVGTTVAVLENKMNNLGTQVENLDSKFDKILCELKDIALGRPTWAVTTIITILSSAVVGMIIYISTHQ